MAFTAHESSALCGLLAESSTDIIFKTDRDGIVCHASQPLERLGAPARPRAGGAHLIDIVHPASSERVSEYLRAVVAGRSDGAWLEFETRGAAGRPSWYEMQMCALADARGAIYGTLGMMRSIDRRRALEAELHAARQTDALTGLVNRNAFLDRLDEVVAQGRGGCVALFAVDWLTAINLRLGRDAGDRVLKTFGELLRALARPDDLPARIGGERFAMVFPGAGVDDLAPLVRDLLEALARTCSPIGGEQLPTTASASLVAIGESTDRTLERAELSLFRARAKGRNRVEVERA